jgi:hypothetical protein
MATSKRWRKPSPKAGAKVDVKRVPETVHEEIAKAHHFKLDHTAPIADFALWIIDASQCVSRGITSDQCLIVATLVLLRFFPSRS